MDQTIVCQVAGMTCGNCALTISKYLEKKGMKDISANAGSGELSFTAPEGIDLERIYLGIEDLGYSVARPGTEEERHLRSAEVSKLRWMLPVCALFTLPLLLHMFVGHDHWLNQPWLQLALCLPVFAIGLYHFGGSAFRSLRNGIPNMDVLIIMGATAAFIYSLAGLLTDPAKAHNYLFFETTATIITFVLLGNWIEERTAQATTSSIAALTRLQPARARIVMTDSIGKESIMEVETKYIRVDDILLVSEGEGIPTDGIILRGEAEIDESMLSGESLPVHKAEGSNVTGGSVIVAGNIRMKATAVGSATTLAEIVRMVQQARAAKPPLQKLADKISAVFVPLVLGIAVLTFLINHFVVDIDFSSSLMRSIAVVVIACPCAMGLATPAAVAVGLGRAARNGILVKGGDTLEQFKNIRQLIFDKTGTLTTGQMHITRWQAEHISDDMLKAAIVGLEQHSIHPIAKSINRQWSDVQGLEFINIQESKGLGLSGQDNAGNSWQLGSAKIVPDLDEAHRIFDLHLLKNGQWVGGLLIEDELRPDAAATVAILKAEGYETILLSGDRKEKVSAIAERTGIDKALAEQSPADKMKYLSERSGGAAMVGDGINDAPALAKADIGISLSDASQVAMQSANVILSGNKLEALPKAIKLGKLTYSTIRQNLFWAFSYNILAIPLAAMGYLSPIWAAIIMAFSDVILVLNSIRLNYRKIG
jgi:Cu+-exporting ATPase